MLNEFSDPANDEDKIRRLEELHQRDNRDRYKEIVNVHAAALNASASLQRTYRSQEDTGGNYVNDEQDLLDTYGFNNERRNDSKEHDDDYFSLNKDR